MKNIILLICTAALILAIVVMLQLGRWKNELAAHVPPLTATAIACHYVGDKYEAECLLFLSTPGVEGK